MNFFFISHLPSCSTSFRERSLSLLFRGAHHCAPQESNLSCTLVPALLPFACTSSSSAASSRVQWRRVLLLPSPRAGSAPLPPLVLSSTFHFSRIRILHVLTISICFPEPETKSSVPQVALHSGEFFSCYFPCLFARTHFWSEV